MAEYGARETNSPPQESGDKLAGQQAGSGSHMRPGVHLTWKHVSYTVTHAKKPLRLLNDVSGQVAPGQMLAVMGASGAGKSTFLNVLGQRVHGAEGSITVNGRPLDVSFKRLSGYVTQDAPFLDTLTVRETLLFTALLRLPESIPYSDKVQRVDDVIAQLDLTKCANTYVGRPTEPGGISGGERRRLTLAMELLFDPYVLLLDEVTTGLDSSSAVRIVDILRRLAHEDNRTVICTIHQPRADILTMFDQLLLLSGGKVVYLGPTWHPGQEDGMLQYFRDAGYPFHPFENPADAVIDLVNAEFLSSPAESSSHNDGAPAPSDNGADAADTNVAVEVDSVAAGQDDTAVRMLELAPPRGLGRVQSASALQAGARRDRAAVIEDLVSRYHASPLFQRALEDPPAFPPPATPRYGLAGRKYPTSWCTQFAVITRRAFLYKLRAPDAVATQFFGSVVMAVIIGSVFWKLPLTEAGVRDRLSAISFIILTQSFMAFDLVVLAPYERAVMLRDTASGMYSTGAFYWGRTAAEAPIHTLFGVIVGVITYWMFGLVNDVAKFFTYVLVMVLVTQAGASMLLLVGAMSKTMAMGNGLATLVLVFASLFNGFYIHPDNIPSVYRWIAEISFPAFGVKAGVANEFAGLAFDCSPDEVAAGCVGSGAAFLRTLGFHNTNVWAMCLFIALEIAVFRVLALLCLHFMYTGQPFIERLRLLAPWQ